MNLEAQTIPETSDRPSRLRRAKRWRLFAGALLVVALIPVAWSHWSSLNRPPPMSQGVWKLRLVDEFDATVLDEASWTTCYWWEDLGCTNKGNAEQQWYRPANVSLTDGLLRLEARSEQVETDGVTYPFTSGMVTSGLYYDERDAADRFSFTYGYLEVRAKIPRGKGLWPAIWLLPTDHTSTPEIDIMEALGQAPDTLEMHYHYQLRDEKQSEGHSIRTTDLSADFHRYGIEWRENEIRWYLDGAEVWRVGPGVPVSATPMYLLINLAVGGEWGGSDIDLSRLPAAFVIDYVKVWQQDIS